MTNPIRDILEDVMVLGVLWPIRKITKQEWSDERDQAEQAINAYILGEVMELLGGDDKVHPKLRKWNEDTNKNFIRNQLRQELRNKVNKKFGGMNVQVQEGR
jgi:hypothetical protein